MKRLLDIKLVKFYLWAGLGYFLLGLFSNLTKYPTSFFILVFNQVWSVVYVIVFNFIFFEYTIPFVVKKKKTIIYNILPGILLFGVYMILYSYGSYLWRSFGIQLHIYTALKIYPSLDATLQNEMAYSTGSIFLFGICRQAYNDIKLKHVAQQLRIEKQEAELSYLKSQTNPHFLFNTLNNIYSLARDKSDLAPESILRLSKIMRFMLYETAGSFIAVEQELKIIEDYIALEKLRYDASLLLNFDYDVEDMKQGIAPLLLIPLVENAFKHGASETKDHPFVHIHLSINQRQLIFQVKNSTEAFTSEDGVKENIGLSNLRRQLELLYTDYKLTVQQNGSEFTSLLKINLASHV